MRSKVVAIIDAHKPPGRGLMRAISEHKHDGFVARAITTNTNSEEARILIATGVQVAVADINDEASLKRAFQDAYAAFYVHTPKERTVPPSKPVNGAAVARAAKEAGLKHVIWATAGDARSMGLLDDDDVTPVFADDAGLLELDSNPDPAEALSASMVPTTFMRVSWHARAPTGPLAEEIGTCAYNILRRPELIGKTMSISDDLLAAEAATSSSQPGRSRPSRTTRLLGVAVVMVTVLLTGSILVARYLRSEAEMMPPLTVGAPPPQPAPLPAAAPRAPPIAEVVAPKVEEEPAYDPFVPENGAADRRPGHQRVAHKRAKPRHGRFESRVAMTAERTPPAPTSRPAELARSIPSPTVSPAPAESERMTAERPAAGSSGGAHGSPAPPHVAALSARATGPAAAESPVAELPPAGFVDPKAVTAVIRGHASEVRGCFDRALMERPELKGRLVVSAMLDGTGRVLSVSPTHTVEGGARLQACVLDAFRGWTFPRPSGGVKGRITYAFSFE